MKKDIFIDGHRWLDLVENFECFLTKIVKFKEDSTMKEKDYPLNYTIRGENC